MSRTTSRFTRGVVFAIGTAFFWSMNFQAHAEDAKQKAATLPAATSFYALPNCEVWTGYQLMHAAQRAGHKLDKITKIKNAQLIAPEGVLLDPHSRYLIGSGEWRHGIEIILYADQHDVSVSKAIEMMGRHRSEGVFIVD